MKCAAGVGGDGGRIGRAVGCRIPCEATTYCNMSLSEMPRLVTGYDILHNVGGRGRVVLALGVSVPVWTRRVCCGRQVKCAAGVGGDGDRIGGERAVDIFTEK